MVVSRASLVATSALMIATLSSFAGAQSGHSSHDPATRQSSSEARDSFVGFSSKLINPSNTDYGECIAEVRSMVLKETVRNAYFWSNIIALGMLGCLFIVVVYQHWVQTKQEWSSAELLAQLEHSVVRSNSQIQQLTERNRALTVSLAALKLAAQQSSINFTDSVDRPPLRPARSHAAVTQASLTAQPIENAERPATERSSTIAAATVSGSQIALFKPEVELVTKVNALEQQLGRSQEVEKQLRRQLNEAGRKLQAEQERNRSLRVDQT